MDQKTKANVVAVGKIVLGSGKIASGLAMALGKGWAGAYLKSHHMTGAAAQFARHSLKAGRELIEEGASELKGK